jgi:hypothetical protein
MSERNFYKQVEGIKYVWTSSLSAAGREQTMIVASVEVKE